MSTRRRRGYRDTRKGGSHRHDRHHRDSGGIHWTTIAIWIIILVALSNGAISVTGK